MYREQSFWSLWLILLVLFLLLFPWLLSWNVLVLSTIGYRWNSNSEYFPNIQLMDKIHLLNYCKLNIIRYWFIIIKILYLPILYFFLFLFFLFEYFTPTSGFTQRIRFGIEINWSCCYVTTKLSFPLISYIRIRFRFLGSIICSAIRPHSWKHSKRIGYDVHNVIDVPITQSNGAAMQNVSVGLINCQSICNKIDVISDIVRDMNLDALVIK